MRIDDFSDKIHTFLKDKEGCYEFWGEEARPSEENIKKAEKIIGKKLSRSYIAFLKQYGGGEIVGDPIFAPFGGDLENLIYEDIAVRYLLDQKSEHKASPNHVIFHTTDFAEIFYFNYFSINENSKEVPIYLEYGGENIKYADTFWEFLYKRIEFIESTGN